MMKNALIIFVKTPVAGLVKTRLQPQISPEDSAELYTAFLKDIDHKFYDRDDFDSWYAVSPENFQNEVLAQIIHLDNYFLQEGKNLGECMNNAFQAMFMKGYEKIVLIGSDLPSITTDIVSQALQNLESKDCVIGPSKDGGYYLIALNSPMSALFENLPWSSSEVLEKTIEILDKNGLTYTLLSEFEDIDTNKELVSFYQSLKNNPKNHPDFPTQSWVVVRKLFAH
jgi:rSAM/selenodomain-associated transferase 1